MASLAERWRWRPPRSLKVTRIGRVYLVMTVGIGLGALNTGNNLLYLVLGFLLAIIVLSGVLSERAIADLGVKRLVPEGVYAGEPFALRYQVSRGKGRAFAIKLTEAGALEGWAWVPWVGAERPITVRADVTAGKRGPLRLSTLEISTFFPFGLFEKSRTIALEDLVVVWPRRGFTCEPPDSDGGLHLGDLGRSRHRDGGGDLLGLRELGDAEDARRVHWVKSASAGRLLKVEREREDRRQYTLTVNEQLPAPELELKCEETAALTHRLLEAGHEVGLEAGGRRIRASAGAGHERRVLTALAWLGFDAPGDARP